jgi:hypothetical protein
MRFGQSLADPFSQDVVLTTRQHGRRVNLWTDWSDKRQAVVRFVQIPMHRGHLLRFDRGQATDLMAATIPI